MDVSSVANSDSFKTTTPSDREIVLTRLFDAPRRLVFDAMSKPEHVRRWWGQLGEGYSVPVCEIDFRPGGAWRFVNRHPKGEAAFHGVYREIAPPERVVFTEIFELFPDVESVITSVLTEEGSKTRLNPARPPLGLASARNEARALEHAQVLRDGGHAHLERLGELGDRAFA